MRARLLITMFVVAVSPAWAGNAAFSTQIGAGDTALLFGGGDAEGGLGDWYLSNAVIEAIVDDAGPTPDLVGVVPAGTEPRLQSSAAPTGGNLIDLGRLGADDDQLSQMFTVGGLSTENFILYDTVDLTGVVTARGKLRLPPDSPPANPCIDIVTQYGMEGGQPFMTIRTIATNACAGTVNGLTGFLDAFVWTQRSSAPFSAGAGLGGGRGFDHAILDFANPAAALEFPTFMAAPGVLVPGDGVVDPAAGTVSGEVAYGLLPIETTVDADGPGGADPVVTPVNALFGVSSLLVTALGPPPGGAPLAPSGTFSYTRRLYVGTRNDVRSVSDLMLPELAPRLGFSTGTISGDVDAGDAADIAAALVVRRLGRCGGAGAACATNGDCSGATCDDPVPTTGFAPGGYVTHVRTEADGTFSGVVLPQGDYEITVAAAERDPVVVRPVTVAAGDTAVAIPDLTSRGLLRFAVREKRKGKPALPAKLVLHGTDGTPDPRLGRRFTATLGGADVLAETFGGTERGPEGDARGQGNVVYTTTGSGAVALRPGTYDVWASRGLEYGVAHETVTITPGGTAEAEFLLKRVLKTGDAISADFHIHSVRSFDSSTPLEDRVASFAAEGVEVMISTDHDKHVDYAPVVANLNLGALVGSIPGVEVTGSVPNPPVFPNSIGHINAWPMPVLADTRRDGSIDDEYVAPNWVFSRLRALGGADTVIQYNHPRAGVSGLTSIGFFNSIGCQRCANAIDTACTLDTDCPVGAGQECTCVGYQPERTLGEAPNDLLLDTGILGPGTTANPDGVRNIDFDVMEIANGAREGDFEALLDVRADWFSLLAQDFRKFGTAVSDSHRATLEHAGWGRTFVLGAGDDPTALDVSAFNARVRAGAMVLSTGPYVEVTARAGKSKVGVGEELAATNGKVALAIRVTSPAWIPVDEVRVLVNGEVVEHFDATTKPRVRPVPNDPESSGKTMRFKSTRKLVLDADAYVIVEAGVAIPADGAPGPSAPEVMNQVVQGVVPYAATNPIFVDVGGDGYTAPGLAGAALARARPGRMTGVTRVEREAAIAAGTYLPIYRIRLPDPAGGTAPSPCGIHGAAGVCGGSCPEGGTCRYWPSPIPPPDSGPPVCTCFPPPVAMQ